MSGGQCDSDAGDDRNANLHAKQKKKRKAGWLNEQTCLRRLVMMPSASHLAEQR